MLWSVLFCGFLAFASQVRSEGLKDIEIKNPTDQFGKWVNEKVHHYKNQFLAAKDDLHQQVHHAVAKAEQSIDSLAESKAVMLRSSNYHPECIRQGLTELAQAKVVAKEGLVACSLTQLAVMGVDVGFFATKVLNYLNDFLNGVLTCSSLFDITCYFRYIITIVKDMINFPFDISNLVSGISGAIKAIAHSCGNETTTKLIDYDAMRNVQLCSLTK